MKKFILKLLLFICLLGLPFFVLNILYKNTNYYFSKNNLYCLKVYPDDITLLNLGNSHESFGIRYDKFYKGTAHNFAVPAQPFIYDYYLLKFIHESIAPGAVVIIPVSYYDWYYDYQELFIEDIYSTNKRYYGLLPPEYIYSYNIVDDIQYNIFPVLTAKDNLKYIFKDVLLPPPEEQDKTAGDDLDSVAESRAKTWRDYNIAEDEDKDKSKEANTLYFKKIIDYCISMGYQPVVVCSPVTEELTKQFSEDFMNDFDSINREVLSGYDGIVFLDYSRDPEFSKSSSYFRDSDHLNFAGREAYTKRLLGDIAELGMIPWEQLNVN